MATVESAVETASSASLNTYSPISTLERQNAAPLGQRLILAIQANAACWLEGGVESILKLKGTQGNLSSEVATNPPVSFEESKDDDFDAFAFLHEKGETNEQTTTTGAKKRGIGGFIRKVAKNTTASLERQMQGLAVRMDHGRNPDKILVGMYDPHTQELIGLTEALPMPTERQDMRFEIPLTLPANRRHQPVILKLWMQSGAALLQTAKAAKNYLLGMATLDCHKLSLGVQTLPLTSNVVVGAELTVCVTPDPKFAKVNVDRDWTLTDPDLNAYSSNLHYLPLDQTYVFRGKKPSHWLLATERSTESTVVLPIAAAVMDLAAKASLKSLHHAQSVAKELKTNRHDTNDNSKSTCTLAIVGLTSQNTSATIANISIGWRRPDSMFELELTANETIQISRQGAPLTSSGINYTFHPKVCTEGILPGVLNACGGRLPPAGYLLGSLHFYATFQVNNFFETWEAMISMESFVNKSPKTIQVPLYKNGSPVGDLLMQVEVKLPTEKRKFANIPSNFDGLVSLVGLENLADGVRPVMDSSSESTNDSLRQQQLATMGYFVTAQYIEQHLNLRQSATESFQDRAKAYRQALVNPEIVQPHETKSPKSFRPSSSRSQALLSAIPFNVHVCTLNVNVLDAAQSHPVTNHKAPKLPGAAFHNVTHGAPSDHASGFGNILAGISNVNVSGGLRRLEAKRLECAQALERAQSMLIAAVGTYLVTARKSAMVNHIPARHAEIQGLRWKVFECVHNLHHVTWMCSVRRANVFSQSLGIAVSSYLASVSDENKCEAGWPDVWRRHGFMVCFEGLLSAAGKELGMIEDAR